MRAHGGVVKKRVGTRIVDVQLWAKPMFGSLSAAILLVLPDSRAVTNVPSGLSATL